ncbi:hypothetical protein FB446DRAFT_797239 [Lentinula raphanica]|nr:hypothetical protein FB446DRAFT_797239 [Lentinula raphanica]
MHVTSRILSPQRGWFKEPDDELDFRAYLNLYNDSSNADNGDDCDLVHPEDSPMHGENSQETVDEWEDIEDKETQLYKEATAFYRKSYVSAQSTTGIAIHVEIKYTSITDYTGLRKSKYPTVSEPELKFDLLAAMDGNDSLKRLKERYDPRVGGDDYFIDPQQVDQWDFKNWLNLPGWQQTEQVLDAKKGCEDRWKNMKRSHTETERGIFDKTGVFVASCRHMFVIWILDMIKTREQRKYALVFLHRFLSAIRKERTNQALPVRGKKAFGYDIGCQFDKMLHSSPLQSLVKTEGVKMLIGSLHEHAHNRRCQLKYLLSYIEGCGLEDLEVLECLFSQLNALASAVRHASKFHRRQMISAWMYHHNNFESYANLSKFIYNNYKQALSILATQNNVLSRLKAIGVQDAKEVFHWLDEEWEYLETREEEPEEDQNKMDLYMRLEQEREEKLMAEVHILEERLDIKEQWSEDSNEWKEAAEMSHTYNYRKCVDKLEGLIVAKIFELLKMHMAGTGYKMRRHLCKALKNRSKAIQEAISVYNSAAAKLSPPRDALDYDDVVEKAYLSELDFLKDTRSNVWDRIWAVPANRMLMAQYFKLYRAWEELDCLHIEIKQLLTYMKEEKEYLLAVESHVATTNPHLAYQISLH